MYNALDLATWLLSGAIQPGTYTSREGVTLTLEGSKLTVNKGGETRSYDISAIIEARNKANENGR